MKIGTHFRSDKLFMNIGTHTKIGTMNIGTQLSARSRPDQNSGGDCGIHGWAMQDKPITGPGI